MLIYIYALIQSSCRFTLLLPVGQWVYDKSRVLPLSAFKSNHSHLFWRGVRGEAFLLDLKQQAHRAIRAIRLLLPVSQWVYDKSRVPLTTQAAESHGLLRVIRTISVRLNLKLQSPPDSFAQIRIIRVLLKTPLRVLTVYPCSRRICPKNATGFVAQRSRLHWHLKQASLPNEASFICGLTILVDHFKLYLYYELTQLLLIYNSR